MVLINPFYETSNAVRETLATGYKAIDVVKYEKQEKRLVIGDSLKKYLGQKGKRVEIAEVDLEQTDESTVKISNKKMINKGKGKSNWWIDNEQMIKQANKMGDIGLSILADAGTFHFMGKTMELLEYESSLPKHFDLNMKAFCIYHQIDFGTLSEEQK